MRTTPPGDESELQVNQYLEENGIKCDYSVFLRDQIWSSLGDSGHYLNSYKFERGIDPSPIQLRVYDTQGKFVTGYSQCYGDFKKLNILKSFPPVVISHLPNNTGLRLQNEFDLMNITDSLKHRMLSESLHSDYSMVLYWNIWSGYFSDVVLQEASTFYLKNNEGDKSVMLILVNTGVDI